VTAGSHRGTAWRDSAIAGNEFLTKLFHSASSIAGSVKSLVAACSTSGNGGTLNMDLSSTIRDDGMGPPLPSASESLIGPGIIMLLAEHVVGLLPAASAEPASAAGANLNRNIRAETIS
jgi:hypothetical protein